MQNDEVNLVVCYGFGKEPMLLITNLKSDDKRLGVAVVKVYLRQWGLEPVLPTSQLNTEHKNSD